LCWLSAAAGDAATGRFDNAIDAVGTAGGDTMAVTAAVTAVVRATIVASTVVIVADAGVGGDADAGAGMGADADADADAGADADEDAGADADTIGGSVDPPREDGVRAGVVNDVDGGTMIGDAADDCAGRTLDRCVVGDGPSRLRLDSDGGEGRADEREAGSEETGAVAGATTVDVAGRATEGVTPDGDGDEANTEMAAAMAASTVDFVRIRCGGGCGGSGASGGDEWIELMAVVLDVLGGFETVRVAAAVEPTDGVEDDVDTDEADDDVDSDEAEDEDGSG
jgi:hypothetical protein